MSSFIRAMTTALRERNPGSGGRTGPSGLARLPAKRALETVADFGPNPGALTMHVYVPARLEKRPPLVVVLHGCQQTAEGYDIGSGWSKLADRGGFPVLYPEQQGRNNPRHCFNWFDPEKTKRDAGEAGSIQAMIAKAVQLYGVDPRRIFICGLSAGGAMTGVMLATYPGLFKAGAIIAGLPYGAATSVNEAIDAMFNGRTKSAKAWGDLVRAAGGRPRRWPNIAIWHGSADAAVKPVNAGELVKQWTNVHGIGAAGPVCEQTGLVSRRSWADASGKPRVLEYMIAGMGHGTPVNGLGGEDDGAAGAFFLPSGLWSSLRIAQDWGLFDSDGRPARPPRFTFLGLEL